MPAAARHMATLLYGVGLSNAAPHTAHMASTTKPRRALTRLIAHIRRELPNADYIEACFPNLDIYMGEDA